MMRFASAAAALFPFLLPSAPLSSSLASAEAPSCDSSSLCEDEDGVGQNALPDYLIVGAGGSGLQTALFLEKYGRTYTILEKSDTVGEFWTKFPRFDELISVNKSVRNATQRFRYDWHSFLESDVAMLDITDRYFPNGKDWHEYMVKVAESAKLKVEYNTEVTNLATDGSPCVHLKDGSSRCASKRVFIGTGLVEKREPILEMMGGIPYSRATKDRARDRRVCILGNGNSGFETLQNMIPVSERATLYGRSPHRTSAVTRYTGDVRVKYLQGVENLNAKLLDTVDYFQTMPRISGLEKTPMTESQIYYTKEMTRYAGWLKQFDCEAFFYATGFLSHVPGFDFGQADPTNPPERRFPETDDWYAWKLNPSIHFVGWLMHERDFRRGAGGFLSGFRYLIRNLMHHVNRVDFGVPYPRKIMTVDEVARHMVVRIQVAHDLIILQDGVVLRDAIVPIQGNKTGVDSHDVGKYFYYEGISYDFHHDIKSRDDVIYLYFGWGNGKTVGHVFETNFRYKDTNKLINFFLHPVIEVGNDGQVAREIHEDLDMSWKEEAYIQTLDKVAREALDGRTASFRPKPQYTYHRLTYNQTEESGWYEMAPLTAEMDGTAFQSLWKAVYRMGKPREMNDLKANMKKWMPMLFEHEDPTVYDDMMKAYQ